MASGTAPRRILAADIGGTNSRFALFEAGADGVPAPRGKVWLRTKEARSFGDLLRGLRAAGFPLDPAEADAAVVAVAGPVLGGVRSAPPFIDWEIDFSRAADEYGLRRPLLVNDFVAQAFATRTPAGGAARRVLPGEPDPGAAVAVVGAGTGLGQAALLPDGAGGHRAVPSEGGHAEFPLVGAEEQAFGEFLRAGLGVERVTSTMVVSGAGLSNVHWHLTGQRLAPEKVTDLLVPGSPTLAWSARFYGRVCKIFALQVAALGGLYVAGGVAARTPALVEHEEFAREFRISVHMTDILARIPVLLMTDQESGLWGAGLIGAQMLARGGASG